MTPQPTAAGLQRMVERTQAYCKLIARRENVLIRMAWAGSAPLPGVMEDLVREKADIESQAARMRMEPGPFELPDPSLNHRACLLEADQLRTQNMQLRVVKDQLWAQNAKLAANVRRLKPTIHPVKKPKRGRPTALQLRIGELQAQFEALLGWDVNALNNGTVYLSRPAMEKALTLFREAEECRSMHQLRSPLKEAVAG